jgi:hypothetical protein
LLIVLNKRKSFECGAFEMRQSLLISLLILLLTYFGDVGCLAAKSVQQEQESVKPLTNQDVIILVKSHLAPEVIAAQLLRSGCDCVISAIELERLKAEGVPDQVLLAMINATKLASRGSLTLTIPRGTVVEIETAYRISSQEIEPGEAISFKVINPVRIGENTVIAAGALATGRVVTATRGGHFGRAGRLVWTMETVNAVDDSRVPIQAMERLVGDSKGAKVATQVAVTAALLWPIAPVALLHGFKRGENAYLAQGRRFEVTVSADTTVRLRSVR